MNLFAGNRDSTAFDRLDEFLPERLLDGRKARTDPFGEDGDKLGVPHLTYGVGRRVCPGIDSKYYFLDWMLVMYAQLTWPFPVANRGLYSALVLLLHFFTWERQTLGEEKRRLVFPPFRVERECSLEMDAIADTATPTEAQVILWLAGIKFHCRKPEGLRAWFASADN